MATPRRRKQGQHGGARQGTYGKQYTNRSDLQQAPRAAPGQTYGKAKEQLDAQRVVPLSRPAPPGSSPSLAQSAGMMGGGGQIAVPPLTAPSARPNEPLTAGLATGPGAGPEVLKLPQQNPDDELLAWLMAAYRQYPNEDLARMMAALDARMDTAPRPPTRNSGRNNGVPSTGDRARNFMGMFGDQGSTIVSASVEG